MSMNIILASGAYLNIGRKVAIAVMRSQILKPVLFMRGILIQIDSKYNTYVYYKNAADFDGS